MTTQSEEVRTDEVMHYREDHTVPNLKYVGRNAVGVATSSATWQIYREFHALGQVVREYAGKGSANQIWDNRASLTYQTGAFSTPAGVQGALVVGVAAVAVKVGASSLADRRLVTLLNNSVNSMYWGWTAAVTTVTGTTILPGTLVKWCAEGESEVVPTIYVISGVAAQNARVTEAP